MGWNPAKYSHFYIMNEKVDFCLNPTLELVLKIFHHIAIMQNFSLRDNEWLHEAIICHKRVHTFSKFTGRFHFYSLYL